MLLLPLPPGGVSAEPRPREGGPAVSLMASECSVAVSPKRSRPLSVLESLLASPLSSLQQEKEEEEEREGGREGGREAVGREEYSSKHGAGRPEQWEA